jgi:hypothetical protein
MMRSVVIGVFMAFEYILGSFAGAEMCPDSMAILIHMVLVFAACVLSKEE